MGYDITIHKATLRQPEFERSLASAFGEKASAPVWGVVHQFAAGGLTPDGRYDLTARPNLWLAVEGSTRGVHLALEEDRVVLTLQSGASRVDFGLAGWIVRQALAAGATAEDEEGAALTAVEMDPAAWSSRTEHPRKVHWGMMKSHGANDDSDITLPVGPLSYRITKADLLSRSVDELEADMAATLSRYGNAFVASLFQQSSSAGGEATLVSNYGLIPTLMQSRVQKVMVACESGALIDEPIPFARFCEIMGARGQEMNGYHYFEGIQPERESELLMTLTGKTPGDIQNMAWRTAAYLPFAAWAMVAMSDGNFDEKEGKAFFLHLEKSVQNPTANPHAKVLSQMLLSGMLKEAMGDLTTQRFSLSQMFHMGLEALNRALRPDECLAVKKDIYQMAETIAKASGGSFFGFGSKVSKEEKAVLEVISKALQL